jgi:hypothetical protein
LVDIEQRRKDWEEIERKIVWKRNQEEDFSPVDGYSMEELSREARQEKI